MSLPAFSRYGKVRSFNTWRCASCARFLHSSPTCLVFYNSEVFSQCNGRCQLRNICQTCAYVFDLFDSLTRPLQFWRWETGDGWETWDMEGMDEQPQAPSRCLPPSGHAATPRQDDDRCCTGGAPTCIVQVPCIVVFLPRGR